MSSGWPPEEGGDRWEPVRHASVVGGAHDSRVPERSYSGYARYTPAEGGSGRFARYDLPPRYDESGWPAPQDDSADASHPSGPLPGTPGYRGPAGSGLYGAPVFTEADYGDVGRDDAGSDAAGSDLDPDARYPVGGYQDSSAGAAGYHPAPYAGDGYGPAGAYEASGAYEAPGGTEPDSGYSGRPEAYQPGGYEVHLARGYGTRGYQGDAGYQQAAHQEPGHPDAAHPEPPYPDATHQEPPYRDVRPDQRGYPPAPSQHGQPGSGQQDYSQQDYGYQDYGDPRYDDPSYGDLAYDDPPYPGTAYGRAAQAEPGYPDTAYPDAAYPDGAYPEDGRPGPGQPGRGYPEDGYGDTDNGYGDAADGYGDAADGYGDAADGDAADGYGDGDAADGYGYGYGDAADGYGAAAAPGYTYGAGPGGDHAAPAYPGVDGGHAADNYGTPPRGGPSAGRPAAPGAGATRYGGDYQADPGSDPAADRGEPAYADDGYGVGLPETGPGGYEMPGFVAAEYATGQYPAEVGTIGSLSAGMPDPAATGMLDASGMLDATGITDSVELYNYHPGAAEASQGFLDAPTPMGTVGTLAASGLGPAAFLDDPGPYGPELDDQGRSGPDPRHRGSLEDGLVLGGAEAGDATGVLEGGAGFFDDPGLAETAVAALPPESLRRRGGGTGGTGALVRPRPGSRPVGRRRGRSGDHKLWIALAGVVVVMAGALAAIFLLAFPSGPGGPAHTLVTPNQLNAFVRRPALEQQMNVGQLRQDVINMSSGQARHVVEAVYEAGNSSTGSTPQIVLFIGGNLLNASPMVSVTSFTHRFKGAGVTSAGSLGGEAACVNATATEPGSVAMCAWFDNDSFGEVVSPTMNATALANTMRQIRPHVELIAKQK
jgi:hypothetical protein